MRVLVRHWSSDSIALADALDCLDSGVRCRLGCFRIPADLQLRRPRWATGLIIRRLGTVCR